MTNQREKERKGEMGKGGGLFKKLCLYGFGSTGAYVHQCLKAANIDVEFVIDKRLAGKTINGIKIISLSDAAKNSLGDYECVISLHNHYADLKSIYDDLIESGFYRVSSIFRIRQIIKSFNLKNGYWLDFNFNLDDFYHQTSEARSLFADDKSKELFDNIIRFRKTGDIKNYPYPSLTDEYTPNDLPRFQNPLRIIDCGAYNGAALRKFEKSGYQFDRILAFEPDPQNYNKLIKDKTSSSLKILLPLASYSKDELLRFESNQEMGSRLGSGGDIQIAAAKIDSVQNNFDPNLIKLDVEGSEADALIGAEMTIKRSRPNLCVSAYHKPSDIYELVALINGWALGYKFYLRLHEHNTFGLVLYCLQDDLIE
jgi:hypothetical protein